MRILTIDGGGIRGVIPAMILDALEKLAGKPTAQLFDVIAGTSAGGFLTLLFTRPGPSGGPMYSAAELVDLFVQKGSQMFYASPEYQKSSGNGMTAPKYPASSVAGVVNDYLGDAQLKDALTEVLVTAYDMDQRALKTFLRAQARTNPDENFLMADVARGTTAFPAIFPAAEITSVNKKQTYHLIDGGISAINPCVVALEEYHASVDPNVPCVMVSLGTGNYVEPLPFDEVSHWGMQGWGGLILVDQLFHGMAQAATREAMGMVGEMDFFRLTFPLTEALSAMDDTSPANIQALQSAAQAYIQKEFATLKAIKELVLAPGFVSKFPGDP